MAFYRFFIAMIIKSSENNKLRCTGNTWHRVCVPVEYKSQYLSRIPTSVHLPVSINHTDPCEIGTRTISAVLETEKTHDVVVLRTNSQLQKAKAYRYFAW